LTAHSSTIDSLTFHVSLVGFVYILTYLFVDGITRFMSSELSQMYWGFFFIWALIIAYIVRRIMEKLRLDYLIDEESMRRITGLSVDFLVIAAITAISLTVVWTFIIPIVIISIVAGATTLIWILYFGQRLWDEYTLERITGLYGMETGTIATGVMLVE